MPIADRMREIDSSGIRKVFELAQKIDNPINLSIGQPDFGPPEEIARSAINAIRKGFNRYTVTHGLEELRDEVRQHFRNVKGFEPEEVMITSGVAGGLLLAFLVLINPGDEVVIPDPYFVIFKHLCHLAGAVPRYVDTYPDFFITPERLEGVMGQRTKLVIINNPGNPTGVLLGAERLGALAELCDRRRVIILADELYDLFVYDEVHESVGKYSRSSLVLGGYSKTYGIPGWRIGYAAGPRKIIDEMIKLQQYSFVCAPSVLQHGVIGALKIDMSGRIREYRRKRELVYEGLKGHYDFVKPGGAFYFFPRSPGGSGEDLVRRAIEKDLLLVPGSVFSERDTHFRLSFAAPEEDLIRGIEVLRDLA